MTVPNPTKQDFDSLRLEIIGFIRTQVASVGDMPARIGGGPRR
jgi:hypothetical protein